MIVLAIDPGTVQSAWLAFDTATGVPVTSDESDFGPARRLFGIEPNGELIERLRGWHDAARVGEVPFLDAVIIERVMSYGMAIGAETIETIHWAGRFAGAAYPTLVYRIPRLTIKMALCHSTRANDATVRAALIDRFGGKAAAIGRKAASGPLYQIKADLWSSLALACCFADMEPVDRAAARLP